MLSLNEVIGKGDEHAAMEQLVAGERVSGAAKYNLRRRDRWLHETLTQEVAGSVGGSGEGNSQGNNEAERGGTGVAGQVTGDLYLQRLKA